MDSVLARQLKKAGIADVSQLPTSDGWQRLMTLIEDHYKRTADDRELLMRSMELSSDELNQLRVDAEGQRDSFRQIVLAINEGLTLLGGVLDQPEALGGDALASVETAKRVLGERLAPLFRDSHSDTTSELSAIQGSLVRLADHFTQLLTMIARRSEVKQELEAARDLQRRLLPAKDVIDLGSATLCGLSEAASECSGDLWFVYPLDTSRFLVLIGDATGHGLSAAMLTSLVRGVADICMRQSETASPARLLAALNGSIYAVAGGTVMMTACASLVDTSSASMLVANAGHHFPLILRGAECKPVGPRGQPLGAAEGTVFEEANVPVMAGQTVVWFTDGIVESESAAGEPFSERRLRASCTRGSAGGALMVRDSVMNAVRSFTQGVAQGDDLTLVVATIR
jgi:serine phosphatase RsbU (regulator of sigma subunit)